MYSHMMVGSNDIARSKKFYDATLGDQGTPEVVDAIVDVLVDLDGWTGLPAFVPPNERRGLVLIDSSFDRAREFARLAKADIGRVTIIAPFKYGCNDAHRKALWRELHESATINAVRPEARCCSAVVSKIHGIAISRVAKASTDMATPPRAIARRLLW